MVDRSFITVVQQHVRRLCGELLPDAVALVDSFAPPDFFLRSVLGNADGKVRHGSTLFDSTLSGSTPSGFTFSLCQYSRV